MRIPSREKAQFSPALGIDGNKRVGHAAMEIFLVLKGFLVEAEVEEQEEIILRLAAGHLERDEFTRWLQEHIKSVD